MKSQGLVYDKLYDTFERKSFFSGPVVSISESCKLDPAATLFWTWKIGAGA